MCYSSEWLRRGILEKVFQITWLCRVPPVAELASQRLISCVYRMCILILTCKEPPDWRINCTPGGGAPCSQWLATHAACWYTHEQLKRSSDIWNGKSMTGGTFSLLSVLLPQWQTLDQPQGLTPISLDNEWKLSLTLGKPLVSRL